MEDQLLKLQVRVPCWMPCRPRSARRPAGGGRCGPAARPCPPCRLPPNAALHRAHSAQTARLRLEQAEFAARDYGRFALPGGRYTALRVELGAAAGRNWFCVLYPALCVAGAQADYPTAGENAMVFGRFTVRLAAVDFVRGLAARIQ